MSRPVQFMNYYLDRVIARVPRWMRWRIRWHTRRGHTVTLTPVTGSGVGMIAECSCGKLWVHSIVSL